MTTPPSSPSLPGAPLASALARLPAPQAPRIEHWIEQLGRRRNDPYAWLKFIPAAGTTRTLATLPVPLREHLVAEMAYADRMLQPLAPRVEHFLARMRARAPQIDVPLPSASQDWHYDFKLPAGRAQRLFTRIGADGREQVLFDEAERARGHAYYRATEPQHSPDHRYLAWAEDIVGDDRHRLCVQDMQSGTIRTLVEADAYGYGGFTFAPSSGELFWIWRDPHSRPTRLYRTPVEGGAAVLVYEEHDPAMFMQVSRTAADGFVVVRLAGPETAEVRLIAAGDESRTPRVVRARAAGTAYSVNEWAGELLMLTDADGAFDRKLVCLDPASFEITRELVPHRAGVPIITVLPFGQALVWLERDDGLHRLVLRRRDGTETTLMFAEPAYTIELPPAQRYDARQVRIVHQTPASPPRWIDVRLADGARTTVGQQRLRDFDPAAYRVERLQAQAPDGESIPITVLSRSDSDSPGPLLLTGYGAYGYANEPGFSLPATVLVDAGFRYAIAHVRGGSEKGRRWFLAGRRFAKRNSMTDFIACAHHLVRSGHAMPGQIVAHGLSAGGLLVGGAMNIAPTLWAGVIAQVPFVDMLNTMSDADHPLVPLCRPDWGDPLSDPQAYDYIASISPYENVTAAAYPPVLCTAGLKDDRVPYWEPAKLIAALRHHSCSGQPAILKLDPDSGHQASGGPDSEFAVAALLWAYAQACVAERSERSEQSDRPD